MTEFLWFRAALLICVFTVQFCCGLLVRHKGIRVNYTRKIVHFSLFFFPVFLRSVFPYQNSRLNFIISCAIAVGALAIYIRPIRENVSIIGTAFLSFDRPEDRPHTLWWLFTQVLGRTCRSPVRPAYISNPCSFFEENVYAFAGRQCLCFSCKPGSCCRLSIVIQPDAVYHRPDGYANPDDTG